MSLALIVMVQPLSLDELTVGACRPGRGDSTGGFEIMGWQWRAVQLTFKGTEGPAWSSVGFSCRHWFVSYHSAFPLASRDFYGRMAGEWGVVFH